MQHFFSNTQRKWKLQSQLHSEYLTRYGTPFVQSISKYLLLSWLNSFVKKNGVIVFSSKNIPILTYATWTAQKQTQYKPIYHHDDSSYLLILQYINSKYRSNVCAVRHLLTRTCNVYQFHFNDNGKCDFILSRKYIFCFFV